MPFLPSPVALAASIVERSAAAASSTAPQPVPIVVCAFPVSGQYGPGSRILYYALVAACILGQNFVLLRTACLAAALLIPAVAALHAIVLASVHVDGAVDMDIYGALQICAVGVLAGPITVKSSGTYFNDPGRNLIFLWTTLVLAGLLSLIVEFFRANPVPCTTNDFSYIANGNNPGQCGQNCITGPLGPNSPLRTTTQNNIYLIENPHYFSFSAAVLVSAACCIPAVLSLVSTWNKILEINFKRGGRKSDDNEGNPENQASKKAPEGKIAQFWWMIRQNLTKVEIPLFGSACLTIVIVGELNFWSFPVFWETESIASVGQWAPIVATTLAIAGSLYTRFAGGDKKSEPNSEHDENHHSHPRGSHDSTSNIGSPTPEMHQVAIPEDMDLYHNGSYLSPRDTTHSGKAAVSPTDSNFPQSPQDLKHINSNASDGAGLERHSSVTTMERGEAHRKNSKKTFTQTIKEKLENDFDDSGFRKGLATSYPLVPGETGRHRKWMKAQEMWGSEQQEEPPIRRQKSRSGSFISEKSVNLNDGVSEPPSPRAEEAAGSSTSPGEQPIRRSTVSNSRPSLLAPPPRRSTVSASTPPPTDMGEIVARSSTTPAGQSLTGQSTLQTSISGPPTPQLPLPSPTIQIHRVEDLDEDAIDETDTPAGNDTRGNV